MISVQFASEAPVTEDDVKLWANAALQNEASGDVAIRITSSEEIQSLNQEFRNKNKPTNVLSFPAEFPPELAAEVDEAELGDIVICSTVVEQEADEQRKTLASHWAHMVVHGMLHLQGYDHIAEQEAEEMEALEIQILAGLGFANPYEMP